MSIVSDIQKILQNKDYTFKWFHKSKILQIKEEVSKLEIQMQKFTIWKDMVICVEHKRCIIAGDDPCCGDVFCHGKCPGHNSSECFDGKGWKELRTKLPVYIFYKDHKYDHFTTNEFRDLLGYGHC